jgi:hypothetical protein
MYPRGQPGLSDDPVMAYVNSLCTAGAAPGSTTTRRAPTRRHDPTRECNVCVATASSSFESEPAPHHHGADNQRRARLNKLAEARRQLDEELDLLHQELGMGVGHAIDARHKTSLCWANPTRGTETGESTDRARISRAAARLRRRHARRSPTTINAPMKVRMPTSTHHLSSGGHPRT